MVVEVQIDVIPGDGTARTAAGHEQNIGELTIAPDVSADYAVRAAAMLQNRRACAVAKKDAGISIGPIGNRRQFFRADHQHRVVRVGRDKLLRDLDSKKKTGASGRDIETGRVFRADFFLDETGGRGKKHVWRGSCDENEIDFFGRHLGLLERPQCSFRRHIAGLLILRRHPAFLDPGAGRDPLVGCIDNFRKVFIR